MCDRISWKFENYENTPDVLACQWTNKGKKQSDDSKKRGIDISCRWDSSGMREKSQNNNRKEQ